MNAFEELEKGVLVALETYSNVHRGSGHNSMVTTFLYDKARDIVLDYLRLTRSRHIIIFCSPLRATTLSAKLRNGSYKMISGSDIGLPIGVCAVAVRKRALPKGAPFQTGGGTTKLVAPDWVVWANSPEKFEAGTPAIINIIAFTRALQLIRIHGEDLFKNAPAEKLTADQILQVDELDKYSGRALLEELRKSMIGKGKIVPTAFGEKPFINLDNAASTPTFTPVWDSVIKTWQQPADIQKEICEKVQSVCSDFLSAPLKQYDIIFTANATEAINLAAQQTEIGLIAGEEPVVINTILEHTSNDLPWRMIKNSSLIRMEVNQDGLLDLEKLEKLLCDYNEKGIYGSKRIRMVAVSGASNVLGVFNDLEAIGRITKKYNSLFLVDAAQLVAHRKVNIEKCNIDFFAFSAHKAYAPFGTGALVARKNLLKYNSEEMSLIRSSGEANPGGIAALGKALILLQRIGMDIIHDEEKKLTTKALDSLSGIEGITIYGIKDPHSLVFERKGGVIAFTLKGVFSNVIARQLAELGGIGIRYGCHCSHILIKRLVGVSPGLERFQHIIATLFPVVRFPGIARISFGIENSEEDINALMPVLNKIAHQSGSQANKKIRKEIADFVRAISERVYTLS